MREDNLKTPPTRILPSHNHRRRERCHQSGRVGKTSFCFAHHLGYLIGGQRKEIAHSTRLRRHERKRFLCRIMVTTRQQMQFILFNAVYKTMFLTDTATPTTA